MATTMDFKWDSVYLCKTHLSMTLEFEDLVFVQIGGTMFLKENSWDQIKSP